MIVDLYIKWFTIFNKIKLTSCFFILHSISYPIDVLLAVLDSDFYKNHQDLSAVSDVLEIYCNKKVLIKILHDAYWAFTRFIISEGVRIGLMNGVTQILVIVNYSAIIAKQNCGSEWLWAYGPNEHCPSRPTTKRRPASLEFFWNPLIFNTKICSDFRPKLASAFISVGHLIVQNLTSQFSRSISDAMNVLFINKRWTWGPNM